MMTTRHAITAHCVLFAVTNMISGMPARAQENKIQIAGAMRNVMMNGDLKPTINLDTIRNKKYLYGIGPADQLRGEILVADGMSYLSYVDQNDIVVKKTFNTKAPFFVYGNIGLWKEQALPESIQTLTQLDTYLTRLIPGQKPFAFKLTGKVNQAKLHVVNLPIGTQINSPDDSHIGQVDKLLTDTDVTMVGFFSTRHKGVFTHHDSNLHIHLINRDETAMGHLDDVQFDAKKLRLLLGVQD